MKSNRHFSPARRAILFACSLALASSFQLAAAQDTFPGKPVHLIVPYGAGGTSDLLARYIGQKLGERWGQQVVVENRAGGGTVIGASAVARSAPDGTTLLLANNTHVINSHLMTDMPYDAINDFTPVATVATSAYLLLLNPSVPAKDMAEFLALAKSQPGKLNFGTHGVGGLTHLAAELLSTTAGIKMQMIQYKGAGPALAGILGNQVDVYLDAPATTLPHIESGKLRPIGISGQTRLSSLPEIPTIAEAGVPGFDVTIWYGLLGPAGIPDSVAQKINADLQAVLSEPEVKERLASLGVTPFPSTRPEFADWMRSEHDKYGQIIQSSGIKAN